MEVIKGVTDRQDLEEQGPGDRRKKASRVRTEEEKAVRPDEKRVQVDEARTQDERAETVENEQERNDRTEIGDARQERAGPGPAASNGCEQERKEERHGHLHGWPGGLRQSSGDDARKEQDACGAARQEVGEGEAHAAL